jgi:hypothetical protein
MSQVVRTTLTCPRCNTSFTGIVEQIIDVGHDPQAKIRLLSGRINQVVCPSCGHTMAVGTPLLYHDPAKELLLVYVPMELNIPQQERERLVGDMTRRLTDSLPQDQRKGYLLQPRQALTIPGLLDMILDADGITEEMREAQREKLRVMEMFLQVSSDEWPRLLDEYEALIDSEFIQMTLATAQNAAETGKGPMAEGLIALYNFLVQNTAAGQEMLHAAEVQEAVVKEVAEDLQELGENITRQDFMDLVLSYADDDDRIQAVVGLMRPALDYTFFQELSEYIEESEGEEHALLESLRERLLELTDMLDQQTQVVLQRAAETLQLILSSEDIDAAIRPRLDEIDDTFLAVLQANIHAAEERKDLQTSARLKQVLEKVLEILRENAPPQIHFINELMTADSDEEAYQLIEEKAPRFGQELLDLMEAVAQDLDEERDAANADRLRAYSDYAANFVGGGYFDNDGPH